MYTTVASLLEQCAQQGLSLPETVIAEECALTGCTKPQVLASLSQRYDVMCESATRALTQPQTMTGDLITGQSETQFRHGGALMGPVLNEAMALSLSCCEVNASMGLICAAPTAGSCGIVPAVLITVSKLLNAPRTRTVEALAVAGGFGAVITRNATVSGAKGGCQAECGSAAAMAAAAAVWLAGGSGEQCANGAAIALINCLGLVCDPVAGLVQLPCSFRNASQTLNALLSADMALAGQKSVIPADQVIDAMYRVGRSLPRELRETALGGIAATEKGKEIEKQIFGTPEKEQPS